MMKALLKRGIRAFERRYAYDASYMTHVVDSSTAAGLRLSFLPMISQYRGPASATPIWAGAALASTLDGDCGPCAQLIVDMAVEADVEAHDLSLCLTGDAQQAGDVGLGFRFAQAAIAGGLEIDTLREAIAAKHGEAAVIAASFAAASGRVYPVMKRGLGYAQACHQLQVGTARVTPHKAA